MSKLHVAVLRGGPSSEYDVSLRTGSTVLKNLPEKYQGYDIFISKDGTWHRDGMERSPDRALTHIDVVFNALHGHYGEDGKVQRTLDHLHIPYTGSDSLTSSVGMNKILTKKAFERHKIKTPYYKVVQKTDNIPEVVNYTFHHFLLPFVVKPASAGSSLGITIVKNYRHLEEALQKAFAFSDAAIIEEYIKGKEATCGVIEGFRGEQLYALIPLEVVHDTDHFDFNAKHNEGLLHRIPGNFSEQEKQEIQRLAQAVHELFEARHYSRADFIVTPKRGIFVLELNTQPTITEQSVFHQSLESVGAGLPDFLDHVLSKALEK